MPVKTVRGTHSVQAAVVAKPAVVVVVVAADVKAA
jgi:hypothetical protein